MLLLFSMFAFAFVFHVVTRPQALVAAQFDLQLTGLARPVNADVPSVPEQRVVQRSIDSPPPAVRVIETSIVAETVAAVDPLPVITATTWPTLPAELPPAIAPAAPSEPSSSGGVITRALAGTGSTLRNVFRKTF
jgi:hypothetical protein